MDKKASFKDEMKQLQEDLNNSDLLESETIENAKKDAVDTTAAKERTLLDLIKEEEKLTDEEVDRWKAMYGKIYAVRFDENETYIYRYLTRLEMKELAKKIGGISGNVNLAEMEDEMIVDKCVLYPKITPDFKLTIKAGTVPTLAYQIRVSSNYLPDAVALDLITRI